jgi:hypothetical protein
MKISHTILAFLFALLTSCSALNSGTIIEANKSFVLGQGQHGSYTASIKNTGLSPVEVFIQLNEQTEATSLGILRKGDQNQYKVRRDTKVTFKNMGTESTLLKIKLSGDTNLSMGYQENN